eukprot:TRINITY_DN25268_c0_g4_i3.p3 TRINITY_DN25268_c0_g4~~TRINITY_DN25268_c0_g4_i3.p3  ORF type:complete len:102 (+),score=14.17 TRINITY_DN25268_c0_g4_i3:656-961(+)
MKLRWVQQVALALSHMHSQCSIPCDVETLNMLLSASSSRAPPSGWAVNLCDFGLAIHTEVAGMELVGSKPYMAPEVWTQAASDVYALRDRSAGRLGGAPRS